MFVVIEEYMTLLPHQDKVDTIDGPKLTTRNSISVEQVKTMCLAELCVDGFSPCLVAC